MNNTNNNEEKNNKNFDLEYEKYRMENILKKENSYSEALIVVALIIFVAGFFITIGVTASNDNGNGFITFVISFVSFGSLGFFLLILSEIITILHDIRRKLYEKKK